MPDKPLLPDDNDFTPLQIEVASQSIEARLEKGEIAKHFDKSKTSEQKFNWLWSLQHLHTVLELEEEYRGKSHEEANRHRRDGNRYFTKHSYLSATDCYTQSIKCAPLEAPGQPDVQHELPMAYANRSAALLHLRNFQLCIRDTELAIEHGFPPELHYKLYDRRGKAYAEMGCQENAVENFKMARELVADGGSALEGKMRDKWLSEVDKQLRAAYNISKALIRPRMDSAQFHTTPFFSSLGQLERGSLYKQRDLDKLPTISPAPPHDLYPSASSALKAQYSDNKGRYFSARQDVTMGDVLVMERGLACVLLPEYYGNHCYECFEKVLAPLPCSSCSTVVFCSKQCRDVSWRKYHQYECAHMALFNFNWMSKLGHLAHRLLLALGAKNIINYMKQRTRDGPDPPAEIDSRDGPHRGGDIGAVFNMVTNIDTRIPESVFDFAIFGAFLVKLLKASGYLRHASDETTDCESDDSLKLIGCALTHLLMVLQCNKKGVKELLHPTDFENPCPADIGLALYPTVALFNHSCYANTFLVYYGNTVVMRAARNIFEGREVTVAYELSFHHLERKQRQMSLKATFSFHCECVACQQVWGMWRDVESEYPSLVCEQCHRQIDISELKDKQLLTCKACHHTNDISHSWNELSTSHDEYSKAIEDAAHGKTEVALPALKRHLALMQRHIEMPWKDMLACELAVSNCYKLRGNKRL